MITTNEIALDQKTFFQILLRLNFKMKVRLLYAVALALVLVWLIWIPYQKQLHILLAAVIIFPLLIIFLTWRTSRNSMNRHFMIPRHFVMGGGELTAHLQNGEKEQFSISRPRKVIRTPKYYLLFTSPMEFLHIPYDAFRSIDDRNWFEQEVVRRAGKVIGRLPK